MKESILKNIKESIDNILWDKEILKERAIKLSYYMYNLYIYSGGDFYQYRSLSSEYFKKIKHQATLNLIMIIRRQHQATLNRTKSK